MYSASDLKKGLKIEIDGDPCVITQFEFSKPGKGQALYRCKIKNLVSGNTFDKTYRSVEKVEKCALLSRDYTFSYVDGDTYVFSDNELLILVHFYYHKKINLKNLKEYFDENLDLNFNEHISMFKAENILITKGVFTEINPYLIKDLLNYFKTKNLI